MWLWVNASCIVRFTYRCSSFASWPAITTKTRVEHHPPFCEYDDCIQQEGGIWVKEKAACLMSSLECPFFSIIIIPCWSWCWTRGGWLWWWWRKESFCRWSPSQSLLYLRTCYYCYYLLVVLLFCCYFLLPAIPSQLESLVCEQLAFVEWMFDLHSKAWIEITSHVFFPSTRLSSLYHFVLLFFYTKRFWERDLHSPVNLIKSASCHFLWRKSRSIL